LVENAIKFGLQTSKKPLSIKIYAKVNNNLEISIFNTGKILENPNHTESTKTGIENTKKRLALYFPDNYSFQLFEENGWVISQILIKNYKIK
jgi:LytS/YehU family sensor histidine kinase